jgi:hypothetical protein
VLNSCIESSDYNGPYSLCQPPCSLAFVNLWFNPINTFGIPPPLQALELQEQREQEKVQEKADKDTRVQERALAKVQKQQTVQRRREEKAMARNARNAAEALRNAQRTADKEAKGAEKQAELVAKASNKGQRRILKKRKVPPKPTSNEYTPKAREAPTQPRSRSGRTIETPAWLLT